MAEESKTLEVQKREVTPSEEGERTRECTCFVPRADIFENDDDIYLVVDLPGVDENSIDITIEKNVLTLNGYTEAEDLEGYALNLNEYEIGDYQRSFRLSNTIEKDKIQAT
ncbi:MAG: Hsp20/alpha crystallin family protein, partial [Anaerolineales bacterium]